MIVKEEHYGVIVAVDPEMDKLRRKHCLCSTCPVLQECEIAKMMLYFCKKENLALAMTRCEKRAAYID